MDSAGKLPAVAFRRGDRLGRYELVCQLAEGGMGEVWLANATGLHGFERPVALKMILPEFRANARFRTMFLDEAKIASKILHENVVSILDVGEENGTLFFAMEYVEGESVRRFQKTLLEHDALSFALSLRVVIEACAGLHAAHELCDVDGRHLEIVHRDISPHNLLLTPRGQVKIIDFGVARARGRLAQATESGTLLRGNLSTCRPSRHAAVRLTEGRTSIRLARCCTRYWWDGPPMTRQTGIMSPFSPRFSQGILSLRCQAMFPNPFARSWTLPLLPSQRTDSARRRSLLKPLNRQWWPLVRRPLLQISQVPSPDTSCLRWRRGAKQYEQRFWN